jgi:hypothetical protein
MKPYWVETGNQLRVAIVPRPRGGDWLEDELDQMKQAGVDVLVSMLQVNEAAELGLSSEAELCEAKGIVFRSFPDRRDVHLTILLASRAAIA